MDHRWGTRFVLHLPVRLIRACGDTGAGILVDASLSGAYIRTGLLFRRAERLGLHFDFDLPIYNRAVPLVGSVARRCNSGIGIEWDEFGTRLMLTVLQRCALTQSAFSKKTYDEEELNTLIMRS